MQTTSERTTIAVDGGSMGAYVARPTEGGKHPGVLVCMEVFGINHHIRSVTDRVAAEGYVALAPDLFHRTAPGIELNYDEQGIGRGIELMLKVTPAEAIADVTAAHGALQRRPDVGGRG